MRSSRAVLLLTSLAVVAVLLGGGLAMKVGAEEGSYRQSVLFAEVLSLVVDNYVDPVQPDRLLRGAYEGMLSGLDPHGAYLSPEEVAQWKKGPPAGTADPGLTVLRSGRTLQVVTVETGSPAAEAGVEIGDQVRRIDGQDVHDLSLEQARRLLVGAPGTTVDLAMMRPRDGFSDLDVTVARTADHRRAYDLSVEEGIGVLTVHRLRGLAVDTLVEELDDVRSRGVERLLIDLRNVADGSPRDAVPFIGLFVHGPMLSLRDPSGRVVESLDGGRPTSAWSGKVWLLANGATADGAEAAISVLHRELPAELFGEATFGMGAEPKLYELEGGAGLLVSSALWETTDGASWNADGVEPDETIVGEGDDYSAAIADQRAKVLARIAAGPETEPAAEAPSEPDKAA